MTVDITVPQLGESVTEATVANWFKKQGDAVKMDEALVELETDKVTMEVYAPADGVLAEVVAGEGTDVEVGALLARLNEGAAGAAPSEAPAAEAPAAAPAEPEAPAEDAKADGADMALSPAVSKLIKENNLDPTAIKGTGKDGRLLKGDVLAFMEAKESAPAAPSKAAEPAPAGRAGRCRAAEDEDGCAADAG